MSIDTEKREFETKAVYFFKQIQIKYLVIAVAIGTHLTHSLSSVDDSPRNCFFITNYDVPLLAVTVSKQTQHFLPPNNA